MRLLVTGGAGFIGSHIVDLALAAGHEVAVVDNLWSGGGGKLAHLSPRASFFQVDITDEEKLARAFDEFQPEVVSHHAAQHDVFFSTEHPQIDARVNILGSLNVLTNCTRVGVRKLIFASTGAVYGGDSSLPLNEETPPAPESPYGIAKLTVERYMRYWQEAHGLNFTIFRYANVYGPRQDPSGEAGVVSIFAKRFLTRVPVRIDWDGQQSKDYVYVEDIARANIAALTRGDGELFCLGTPEAISVQQIYETLAQITGYHPEIIRAPKRAGDIYLSYFDCAKAQRLLDWHPTVPFVEGVSRTVASLS